MVSGDVNFNNQINLNIYTLLTFYTISHSTCLFREKSLPSGHQYDSMHSFIPYADKF